MDRRDYGVIKAEEPKVQHNEGNGLACMRPSNAILGDPRHFVTMGCGLTIFGPSTSSEEAQLNPIKNGKKMQ